MRELDVLLSRYLSDAYASASDAEKAAFERLLALSDPQLVGYLLKGELSDDPDIEKLLERLRA